MKTDKWGPMNVWLANAGFYARKSTFNNAIRSGFYKAHRAQLCQLTGLIHGYYEMWAEWGLFDEPEKIKDWIDYRLIPQHARSLSDRPNFKQIARFYQKQQTESYRQQCLERRIPFTPPRPWSYTEWSVPFMLRYLYMKNLNIYTLGIEASRTACASTFVALLGFIGEYPEIGENEHDRLFYCIYPESTLPPYDKIRSCMNRAMVNSPYADRWVAKLVAEELVGLCPEENL